MFKRHTVILSLIILVCSAGAILFWQRQIVDKWLSSLEISPFGQSSPEKTLPGTGEQTETGAGGASGSAPLRMHIEGEVSPLPPPPPLPLVSPEKSQAERREAFQLRDSVDFLVLKDEPFEVGGRKITIAEILGLPKVEKELLQVVPYIQEKEIGSTIRRPMVASSLESPAQTSAYYGIRIVRPTENVWSIHHAIIREYFARRQVVLPKDSDKPYPDGRSSGIGRLLKFIEGAVYAYNLNENRFEKDINVIKPYAIVVFFKVSDLFDVLDNLKAEDLKSIRYVSSNLRLEREQEMLDLLDRRALME